VASMAITNSPRCLMRAISAGTGVVTGAPALAGASLLATGFVLVVVANANVVVAKNISDANRGKTPQDRLAVLKVEWVTWVMVLWFWLTKEIAQRGVAVSAGATGAGAVGGNAVGVIWAEPSAGKFGLGGWTMAGG
jgi:hypothetical protein